MTERGSVPEPTLIHGEVGKTLDGLEPHAQAKVKAKAHANLVLPRTTWVFNDKVITVLDGPWYEDVGRSGRFGVRLRATVNGRELALDNPFYFINPPIHVPTGRKVFVPTDDVPVEIEQHTEDIERAFYEMVSSVVQSIHERI
jgi:hypothetical protein